MAQEALTPSTYDPKIIDAQYKEYIPLSEWASLGFDQTVWDRYSARFEAIGANVPRTSDKTGDFVSRVAAIETGAIEGLYDTDRGFTMTVAAKASNWETILNEKGPEARSLIESQFNAYEYILDLATGASPFAEAMIRELHSKLCEGQDTYSVLTPAGYQNQRLPKGQYKTLPNHVWSRNDIFHAFAPVDHVATEMYKLCEDIRSDKFQSLHPVLQSAFSHYCFVHIHPFADGNGRAARAIASIFSYRAYSMPIVILSERRNEYIDTLEIADNDNFAPFIQFIMNRYIDTLTLLEDDIATSLLGNADDFYKNITALYTTSGGYTHNQVEDAGIRLADHIFNELNNKCSQYMIRPEIGLKAAIQDKNYVVNTDGYRQLLSKPGKRIHIQFSSQPPADAQFTMVWQLEIPNDCDKNDELIIIPSNDVSAKHSFSARISDVTPDVSSSLQWRINMFVERILSSGLSQLESMASSSLKEKGY